MGTHPIFESDFDCLTEMQNCVRNLSRLTKMSVAPKVAPTRLVIRAANQLQYDPDEPILGITRRDDEFIENPAVHDETKMAMIKYMQTGEIQPCTGAGLNPLDKSIAKYPHIWTICVCFSIIPLSIGTFVFCRSRWYKTKKRKLKTITHEIRKLKRERAVIKNEIEINKETLQSLNAIKQAG